ncbi:diaminopimelate epimerase [Caulobacter sp. 17J80-11]|uniref:diaminopimelate epimerase n=1 Tax=Caulobacter sp. 17J80-11 TaxID=2763502 RepID=UPI001653604C|nr:diaminopimelate epimerase [Caulobacter sp. 17J80-11]MBC6983176.1 diaminopimelate epimerase [Caulobacter sp. 17J80-11]
MSRPFLKMNGLGNAFVVVEARDAAFQPTPEQVRAWADRARGGPGFDQLIAIEKSDRADAFMRVWNADGSLVETCGNALRCVGWLLMEASGRDEASIDTLGGLTRATRAGDKRVAVDMGEPRLRWDEVPLAEEMDTRNIELQVGPIDNPHLHTPGAVSMGNPHVVFFVADAETAPVREAGSLIEHHPLFPEGVNVGFAQAKGRDRIRLKVWERGAGLTQACGTGACAALVASHRRGLVDRKATMELDGGELEVEWRETDNRVIMTGPVALEGTGTLA